MKRAVRMPVASAAELSHSGPESSCSSKPSPSAKSTEATASAFVAQVDHTCGVLLAQQRRHARAHARIEARQLLADLLVAARRAEHLVQNRLAPSVLVHEVLELGHERLDHGVDRLGPREPLLELGHSQSGVVADGGGKQPLLGSEVVVEQPPRDARLPRHAVERGPGGAVAPTVTRIASTIRLALRLSSLRSVAFRVSTEAAIRASI